MNGGLRPRRLLPMKLLQQSSASAAIWTAVLVAFSSWLPSNGDCAAAKTYTIDLGRPAKLGDEFTVVSSIAESSIIVITAVSPGTPPASIHQENQQRVIHLEAEGEVLAVFPNGGVQKVALTVKKLRISSDSAPDADTLPAGTKVVAEKMNKQAIFTVDGKPATTTVAEVLSQVDLTGDSNRTDQQVFGPSQPVAIGDTWEPNALLAAQALKDEGSLGDSIDVRGTVKLDDAKGEGDGQIATVSYHLDLSGMKAPLPRPFAPKSGEGKVDVTLIYSARRQGAESKNMVISASYVSEAASPDGRLLTATVNIDQQRKDFTTWR
jgi:hypothetical protein